MRFTIVGAGALGTILGAHLGAAGHPVRMLARGRRAEQLARDGLVVHGIAALSQPCEVITTPDPARDDDVLVFAVKTYHMADALAATAGLRPASVFSLANGVMKNDQLRAAFGPEAVLGCMANVSGELQVDGRVLFTRNVRLAIGGPEPRASEIAAVIPPSRPSSGRSSSAGWRCSRWP
jgi:2-dehydropantoate 2-reductase